ncbi:AfsR/SARP family transcriptional regulator [Streptomyces sp. GS7]|uniref:AfsR/SARP family transcriptional regulator n=1 Tax=Streptomyces sp. GS7 TaxID=2692234 RepID=UPI0013196E48|nr:BTAD domain-containing putative transcriptional regulator [Streptomyces sp. GS7]QHC22910.1 hypothetical protein GR130_17205 [Streptomyces sp. GS7]
MSAAAPEPAADGPGYHLVGEGADHRSDGPEPTDVPTVDVGLWLLGIALRLIQGAEAADAREPDAHEPDADEPDADARPAAARRLLSVLDADGRPTALESGARPRQHRGSTPTALASPTGRRRPQTRAATHRAERAPRVAIWCFGGFRMAIGDRIVDWMKIRPRARAAMRLLAMRAGRPVHKEALIEALWPDAPLASATANLQVAISSLRGLLEPDRERRKPQLVVRTGDAYLLNLPADAYLDTLAFQTALTRSRRASAVGDTDSAVADLRDALASYSGELLPEDGPAEWLQHDREMYRRQAANAAAELAAAELAAGNPRDAVVAAEKCLVIDAFHDTGWQLLVRAYRRLGAPAAAERARRRYAAMLASLGIDTDGPGLANGY